MQFWILPEFEHMWTGICKWHQAATTVPYKMFVRARGFNALLLHYKVVIDALDKLSDETGPMGAKSKRLLQQADVRCTWQCRIVVFLHLTISHRVFSIVEQLAISLQKKITTLSGAREIISNVVLSLNSMRRESQLSGSHLEWCAACR